MTDRPIIFSAPMVRALLAGRKTQTREIFKLPTRSHGHAIYERKDMGGWESIFASQEFTFHLNRENYSVAIGLRQPSKPET